MRPTCQLFYQAVLAAIFSAAVVESTIEWALDMPVSIFMGYDSSRANIACKPSIAEAIADKDRWVQIAADVEKNVVVVNPNKVERLIDKFFLVNGIASDFLDLKAITRLQVHPLDTDAQRCWSIQDGSVILEPCSVMSDLGPKQTFRVNLEPHGISHSISFVHSDLGEWDPLQLPEKDGDPIRFEGADGRKICVYGAASGTDQTLSVSPSVTSASKPYYSAAAFKTGDLALTALPNVTEMVVNTPGCERPDGSKDYDSMGCLIATAFNGADPVCVSSDPQAPQCIVNFLAPFCGDLIDTRAAYGAPIAQEDVDNALEACARRVSQGPCVANPTGLACASSLFAGIKYPFVQGGKVNPKLRLTRQELETMPLFPTDPNLEKEKKVVDFLVGFVKSQLNTVSFTVKTFAQSGLENNAILCLGLANLLADIRIKNMCYVIWRMHQRGYPALPYESQMEKAGGIVGDIVRNLLMVVDGLTMGNTLTPDTWVKVVRLFAVKEVAEGFVLRTAIESNPNAIEIVKLIGSQQSGNTSLFASADEASAALETAGQTGFRFCEEVGGGNKIKPRSLIDPRQSVRRLGCPAFTWGDSIIDNPINAPKKTAVLVPAKQLSGLENSTLAELHNAYSAFVNNGTETAPTWSPELRAFADRIGPTTSRAERAAIRQECFEKYVLTGQSLEAIDTWALAYKVSVTFLLRAGLNKLPNYEGLATRITQVSQDTVNMLLNGDKPENATEAEAGVYNVRDLVVNLHAINTETPGFEPHRFIMTATPGVTHLDTATKVLGNSTSAFVIKSKFGKYITPLTQGEQEVAFIDIAQGRFKFLGYAGPNEQDPSVFYFENIP